MNYRVAQKVCNEVKQYVTVTKLDANMKSFQIQCF